MRSRSRSRSEPPAAIFRSWSRDFPICTSKTCDGTDPLESYAAFKRAVEYCRARKGPAFVHAKVIRPYSHSLSDDEKLYRPDEERQADADDRSDQNVCRISDERGHRVSRRSRGVTESRSTTRSTRPPTSRSRRRSPQARNGISEIVFSPDVDPTDRSQFDTEDGCRAIRQSGTMVDLINRCMHEEMERDPRIVVFGEDVADCSREEYLDRSKAKAACLRSRPICSAISARPAFSIRRLPRRISSAVPSAWRSAD